MMRIRLPPELKDRIADAAKASGRSMNAEIVHTLSKAYPAEPKEVGDDPSFEEVRALHRQMTLAIEKWVREQDAQKASRDNDLD